MDIDRKTEQSEIKDYKKIDQVLEVLNEKKHGSLLKNEKKLLKNEEKDNKQNRSFQKEKEIYEECKERQDIDNNRIFELKRKINKRAKYPGSEEKVQGFRREYALKNKKEIIRKGKEKENQYTYLGSRKTESSFALAKSLETIISFLMSDIKIKLYKKISKGK
ncbi:13595_t:CDS:2 [Gigaspora margarita]|uniref:13595_t:CDS:1 n=1 Tax=Gigaspora margarita TaxID=4874 RepID=A0ABN7WJV5_GIGMA|nr:13595_t:CDS:2 [Gigaspora margarita]